MIEPLTLAPHALWIFGLALILCTLSLADWQAQQQPSRLRDLLPTDRFQLWIALGFGLISLSLIVLASVWWERLIWGVFAGIFLFQAIHHFRNWRRLL